MAYTPTEWRTGDTITAEKLNHMEDGISNVVICNVTIDVMSDSTATSDLTYDELNQMMQNNKSIFVRYKAMLVTDGVVVGSGIIACIFNSGVFLFKIYGMTTAAYVLTQDDENTWTKRTV